MPATPHTPTRPAPPPAAPPMARAAPEKRAPEKAAYPAQWRADIDGPIVNPLITAGTFNVQQYVGIQFPLSYVLLTTTGVSVVNTDPTYTAWLGVPNTLGPIQSVARPTGS